MFRNIVASIIAMGCAAAANAQSLPGPVALEGERIFPESLDVGPDGTLYIGSIGKGAVMRAAPGASKAAIWIDKAPNKLSAVIGVLADEASNRLFVCSSDLNRLGEPVSLKTFNLQSGALIADYPFPESKGLCNDIAIGKDGVAYATDTPGARIFRLKPGATALEPWVADPRFEGVDGLAFGQDGQLYINNVRTNLLFRIDIKADGSAGAITQLQTSRPLEGPDGMRPAADGRFVIGENRGGKVSVGTVTGDKVELQTLREGLENPAAVGVNGNTIWVAEMKSKYRNDPAFKDANPGPFTVMAIPLPPKK